jgi:hypothetical protein
MLLARKVSLKRFLEKRKTRLTAADPYPAASETCERRLRRARRGSALSLDRSKNLIED